MDISWRINTDGDEDLFKFTHNAGYELCIRKQEEIPDSGYDCWFRVEPLYMAITAGELQRYPEEVRRLVIDPKKTYLEVGPGLGAFIPYLVQHGAKPTAIDIADYKLMREMLLFAAGQDLPERIKLRISQLVERCNIMLDPDKVNFLNKSLVDIIVDEDINDPFDVAVDVMGAKFYQNRTSDGMAVRLLERALVRPEGQLITFP